MGFRSQFESLVRFHERWRGTAAVFMVYGKEAFPAEARWPAPVPDGRPVFDPQTQEARLELVDRFAAEIGGQLPFLVDDLENGMMRDYDAYPFRVYAIAPDGRIAVASDKGASGFAPTLARIEGWLAERAVGPAAERPAR